MVGNRKGCGGGYRINSGRPPGSQTPEEKAENVARMNAAKAAKKAERLSNGLSEAPRTVKNRPVIEPEGTVDGQEQSLGMKTPKTYPKAPAMLKKGRETRSKHKMTKLEKNNALVAEAIAPFAHLFDVNVLAMDPLAQIEFGRFYHLQKFMETQDPKFLKSALEAAVQSLPYLRPKLANVQNNVEVKHSWNTLDLNQINAILAAVDEKPLVIDANDLNNAKNVDDGGNDE